MGDELKADVPQEIFNSLVIQLLIDVKSRQIAIERLLSVMAVGEFAQGSPAEVFARMETEVASANLAVVTEIYEQFGSIYPELGDFLNPKYGP